MPQIDYTREEYNKLKPVYDLIEDCVLGQEAIKAKTDFYLPRPDAADKSEENRARYDGYLARAIFYNVASNTLEGLVGQVFTSDPAVDVPAPMDVMRENADGEGQNLDQLCKAALDQVMGPGRGGLFMDFPKAPVDEETRATRAFTREEVQNGMARPTLRVYNAKSIINWRTKGVGANMVLTLVVLHEKPDDDEKDDGFKNEAVEQWRELRLEPDGYVVRVWRKVGGQFTAIDEAKPVDYAGNRLTYIPFVFMGPKKNTAQPNKPPLYDICVLNIGHYHNSADYEEAAYMMGQPTLWASGVDKRYVEEVWQGKVRLGSRGGIPLPQGGQCGLLQVTANTMAKEAMDAKERQMMALGAKLISDKAVERTLGQAKMENAAESSVLASAAKNVAAAFTQCLRWASTFYGAFNTDTIWLTLSTDFAILRLSPEERQQLISEWQAGAISFMEMRDALRQSGVATLDDEEAKAQIEEEGPKLTLADPTKLGEPGADPVEPVDPAAE